jgi:methionyl-tRNA synthetase
VTRFYITTPIYYVNAEPHLGHAYSTIVADAIARARRLRGEDVFFLTGTDEHGQKVERAAKAKGMTPQAFTDTISESFRALFRHLNITNDDFIRTTEPRHFKAAQAIWRAVRDNGFLYKSTYEGWYCTVDEVFVPETQLVNGRCPDCGNAVERLSEESYFFKLSAFQDRLLEHYEKHPEFLTPDIRLNEIATFVKAGLKDLSVSRTSFKWGIPVPDDPTHVMYVWFDALTNYLTAIGYPDDAARFGRYWPADVHLMGKEIIRQHAVYWPAFLMAAGLELPRRIIGHGWWLMNDAKMSKSLGNVVRPDSYTKIFGVDALRYFVLREATLGNDANFSDDALLTRYNADLANDLGNLASRSATMIHRYCEGVVPASSAQFEGRPEEGRLSAKLDEVIRSVNTQMADTYAFSQALRDIWDLIGLTNRYIATREPWALARDPEKKDELATVLHQSANALRVVGALIEPVMPETSARIRTMLGTDAEDWNTLKTSGLKAGTRLGSVEPLFPRIDKTVEELRHMSDQDQPPVAAPAPPAPAPAAPAAPAPPAAPAAADNRISIDDFMKVELRVAKILAAEAVPKSKKLVKLQVDLGTEQRTIVAGIAEAYEPDSLVGRTIVVVANLKPAKLMGIESNGMVLAASSETGKPILLSVEADPGFRVR